MKRNVITLTTGYNSSISVVFDDESLVEQVYGAFKQAKKIEVEFTGLKMSKVAGETPQFSMEFFDVLQPEEFDALKARYDAVKLEEANRAARKAEIEVAYAEQELLLAACSRRSAASLRLGIVLTNVKHWNRSKKWLELRLNGWSGRLSEVYSIES